MINLKNKRYRINEKIIIGIIANKQDLYDVLFKKFKVYKVKDYCYENNISCSVR
jgi:hypothetical protein